LDAHWDLSQQDAPSKDFEPMVVVHAAAKLGNYGQSLSDSSPLFDVNVTGTLRVAQWCASKGVQTLVLLSSAVVYGEWEGLSKSELDQPQAWKAGPYAVSKWCGEQVAKLAAAQGVELAILRLSSLYGVGYETGLIPRFLFQAQGAGNIDLEPPFDDSFDFLHVSDAVQTVQSAVESRRGGLWNVGGGKLITIRELAETCARHLGAQVTLSSATPSRPKQTINWVDDRRARTELGHQNRIGIDEGISELGRSLTVVKV